MRVFINPTIQEQVKALQKQVDNHAKSLKGMILTWRHPYPGIGRVKRAYEGRTCEVLESFVDDHSGEIMVRVRTHKKEGIGFLEDNDAFHRTYRGLDAFEPITTLPQGLVAK
jgi:hypothetical protein